MLNIFPRLQTESENFCAIEGIRPSSAANALLENKCINFIDAILHLINAHEIQGHT